MNDTLNPKVAKKMFPVPPLDEQLECPCCRRHPSEISEYIESSRVLNLTPVEYVKEQEGTYCQYTGYFVCTKCYIKIGMPSKNKLHTIFPSFRIKEKPLPGQNNSYIVDYLLRKY